MPKPPPFHGVRSRVRDKAICVDATTISSEGASIFIARIFVTRSGPSMRRAVARWRQIGGRDVQRRGERAPDAVGQLSATLGSLHGAAGEAGGLRESLLAPAGAPSKPLEIRRHSFLHRYLPDGCALQSTTTR